MRQGSFAAVARERNIDPSSVSRSISSLEQELGISIGGRNIISNAIGLQQCAIAGMGLALLPYWLVNEDLEAGTLIKVLPNYDVTATNFDTLAWLVYPSRTYVPLKVKVFIDFLKKHLSK